MTLVSQTSTTPSVRSGTTEANDSLFVAGHPYDNAVAEFEIPDVLGDIGTPVADLPVVEEPLQPFAPMLDRRRRATRRDRPDQRPVRRRSGSIAGQRRAVVRRRRRVTRHHRGDRGCRRTGRQHGRGSTNWTVRCTAGGVPLPGSRGVAAGPRRSGGDRDRPMVLTTSSHQSSFGRTRRWFTLRPLDQTRRDLAEASASTRRSTWTSPFSGGPRFLDPDALGQRRGGASDLWNFLAEASMASSSRGTSSSWSGPRLQGGGAVDSGASATRSPRTTATSAVDTAPTPRTTTATPTGCSTSTRCSPLTNHTCPARTTTGRWRCRTNDLPSNSSGHHAIIGASFDPGQ